MSSNVGESVVANGIDATTGGYLLPPMTQAEIVELARGETTDEYQVATLAKLATPPEEHLGLPWDLPPEDLARAGWGFVFAKDEDPEVKAALEPLRTLRTGQVPADLMKELDYLPDESRQGWLARHGVAAGNIDPTRVPFYLLVVGVPERIPFGFCQELSVEYAVGLLSFESAAEYGAYAAGVVAAESNDLEPRSALATFFAPRCATDPATRTSADKLVKPIVEGDLAGRVGCRFEAISGEAATHEALAEVLARRDATAPALLFTASHGLGFAPDNPNQRTQQGALVCQDWPGPGTGPLERGQYFTAADVADDADVAGLFTFHFACFGGGTPARDRFAHTPGEEPPKLADAPFAAALPQRLLAHPTGGALGCIAHVERAWGFSFFEPGAGPQLVPFENAIGKILSGWRIGLALKDFNEKYAALSVALAGMLEQVGYGKRVPDEQLASGWIQRNDAEGFALFGDPAARVRLAQPT